MTTYNDFKADLKDIGSLVTEVEMEYRSILNAPDDDPNVQKLHHIGALLFQETDNQKEIERLAKEGYDAISIAKSLQLSLYWVKKTIKKLNIDSDLNKTFKYCVMNDSNFNYPLMYTNTIRSIINYWNLHHHNEYHIQRSILAKNGLYIKEGEYLYKDIPDGSLFYKNGEFAGWYMKQTKEGKKVC